MRFSVRHFQYELRIVVAHQACNRVSVPAVFRTNRRYRYIIQNSEAMVALQYPAVTHRVTPDNYSLQPETHCPSWLTVLPPGDSRLSRLIYAFTMTFN